MRFVISLEQVLIRHDEIKMDSYLSLEAASAASHQVLGDANSYVWETILNVYINGETLELDVLLESFRELWLWIPDSASTNTEIKTYKLKWILRKNAEYFKQVHSPDKQPGFRSPSTKTQLALIDEQVASRAGLIKCTDKRDRTIRHILSDKDNISVAAYNTAASKFTGINCDYEVLTLSEVGVGDKKGPIIIAVLGETSSTAGTPTKLWGINALSTISITDHLLLGIPALLDGDSAKDDSASTQIFNAELSAGNENREFVLQQRDVSDRKIEESLSLLTALPADLENLCS